MDERGTEDQTAGGEPHGRPLAEIVAELAQLSSERRGEASVMREAVIELSQAVAQLLEMVREDRAEQRERVAELERELAEARRQLDRAREAGFLMQSEETLSGSDFDRLRLAAEQLRASTEKLVRSSASPAAAAAQDRAAAEPAEAAAIEAQAGAEPDVAADEAQASAEVETARQDEAGEGADVPLIGAGLGSRPAAEEASAQAQEAEVTEAEQAAGAFGAELAQAQSGHGVLRVFPGALAEPAAGSGEPSAEEQAVIEEELAAAVQQPTPVEPTVASGDAPDAGVTTEETPQSPVLERKLPAAPITLEPRSARKRKATLRRRRIDARKLEGVDPAAAMRAMASAVDPRWTAGREIDVFLALTDGGTLHVTGGAGTALAVSDAPSGPDGATTVTLASDQLLPLFGRLELTDEQPAPELHGPRRDADILVGWIDRAQRLLPELL